MHVSIQQPVVITVVGALVAAIRHGHLLRQPAEMVAAHPRTIGLIPCPESCDLYNLTHALLMSTVKNKTLAGEIESKSKLFGESHH